MNKPPALRACLATLLFLGTTSIQLLPAYADEPTTPRILEVDRLGSTAYKTLASAAKAAKPGDTIQVKPNTGPYREILDIKTSGTAENPIVFDGGNNIITGFEPLTGWEEKDGVTTCRLPLLPCVLSYKGERLVQDYATKKFTKYADLNEANDTLTLRPGTEKTDWEYSKRALAVSVSNVSHQIYRNVRASGSTNDGFNLHGKGSDLQFENIEGFYNLDEGFSSHDDIQISIKGGKFWGNDNGIANSYTNKDAVSNVLKDVDLYDNLGFGLVLHDCNASLDNVRAWNNGVTQIKFFDATLACEKVIAFKPPFSTRQLVSYTDSKDSNVNSPATVIKNDKTTITGHPPLVAMTNAPFLVPQK